MDNVAHKWLCYVCATVMGGRSENCLRLRAEYVEKDKEMIQNEARL